MKKIKYFLLVSFTLLSIICSAQPDEYFRGRYQESGMKYGNPYTMFNRKNGDWQVQLTNIRQAIINGLNKIYTFM